MHRSLDKIDHEVLVYSDNLIHTVKCLEPWNCLKGTFELVYCIFQCQSGLEFYDNESNGFC